MAKPKLREQVYAAVLKAIRDNTPNGAKMDADSKFDDFGVQPLAVMGYLDPIRVELRNANIPTDALSPTALRDCKAVKDVQLEVFQHDVLVAFAELASEHLDVLSEGLRTLRSRRRRKS